MSEPYHLCLADMAVSHVGCDQEVELTCDLEAGHPLPHWDEDRLCAWQPMSRQPAGTVARDAEVLHSEHHPGTFVPSLDSCPEHDRADYEARVREMNARSRA